jgi:hypothetical protein
VGTGANVLLLPLLLLMLMRVLTSTDDACQHVSLLFEVRQSASMLEDAVAIAVSGAVSFSIFYWHAGYHY